MKLNHVDTGRKQGETLLFLHGFMGDLRDWHENMEVLSGEFHCVAVDLPGHGATLGGGDTAEYGMPATAAALDALLDGLGVETCSVVGYSMGGRMALYFALACPRRIRRLVLESASPGLKSAFERDERIRRDAALADRLETDDFVAFVESWYSMPMFEGLSAHEPRFTEMTRRRMGNRPAELAKSLRAMGVGSQPSLWENLPQLSAPTLLVVGERDSKFMGIAGEMAKLCPAARVHVARGLGHNVHFEDPAGYTVLLREFFTNNGLIMD